MRFYGGRHAAEKVLDQYQRARDMEFPFAVALNSLRFLLTLLVIY